LRAPQSRNKFSTLGCCSFSAPPERVCIAGQPKTAFTGPFFPWMVTRCEGAIWWSTPPFLFK